ncbi:MAG: hypothetical protein ABII90_07210 [Bacteroidota bacterium]
MDEIMNDDLLRKFFRETGMEKPSRDFTSRIMNRIEQSETVKDSITQGILQKAGTESPSAHFTRNVMQQVSAPSESFARLYEPVISKKGWYMIAAFIMIVTGIGFLSNNTSSPVDKVTGGAISIVKLYMDTALSSFNSIMTNFNFSLPLLTSLMVIGLLLLLDRLINRPAFA